MDKPRFGDTYTALAPVVYGVCVRMLGDHALAEDVVQETFTSAHKAWRSFRGESSVKTWVMRIAVNAALRAREQRARERALTDASVFVDLGASNEALPVSGKGADVSALLRALDGLPDEQRDVLALMTAREIPASVVADLLGVPEGTVYSRAYTARKALRRAMASEQQPAS